MREWPLDIWRFNGFLTNEAPDDIYVHESCQTSHIAWDQIMSCHGMSWQYVTCDMKHVVVRITCHQIVMTRYGMTYHATLYHAIALYIVLLAMLVCGSACCCVRSHDLLYCRWDCCAASYAIPCITILLTLVYVQPTYYKTHYHMHSYITKEPGMLSQGSATLYLTVAARHPSPDSGLRLYVESRFRSWMPPLGSAQRGV